MVSVRYMNFFTFYNFKKRIIVKNIILIKNQKPVFRSKKDDFVLQLHQSYIKPNIKEAEKSMFLSLLSYGTK